MLETLSWQNPQLFTRWCFGAEEIRRWYKRVLQPVGKTSSLENISELFKGYVQNICIPKQPLFQHNFVLRPCSGQTFTNSGKTRFYELPSELPMQTSIAFRWKQAKKCFVNRALRYFLLDMVRDGKSVAKPHSLSEKILLWMCVHTHTRKCRRVTCKVSDMLPDGMGNSGMLCESKSISHPSSAFYGQLFSSIVFS